jgi:hypothetical protein
MAFNREPVLICDRDAVRGSGSAPLALLSFGSSGTATARPERVGRASANCSGERLSPGVGRRAPRSADQPTDPPFSGVARDHDVNALAMQQRSGPRRVLALVGRPEFQTGMPTYQLSKYTGAAAASAAAAWSASTSNACLGDCGSHLMEKNATTGTCAAISNCQMWAAVPSSGCAGDAQGDHCLVGSFVVTCLRSRSRSGGAVGAVGNARAGGWAVRFPRLPQRPRSGRVDHVSCGYPRPLSRLEGGLRNLAVGIRTGLFRPAH